MSSRFFLATLFTLLAFCQAFAEQIELRDGSSLNDVSSVSVSEDGILLANGALISLDRIRRATIKSQEDFDRLHQQLSLDLFRLKVRILNGDYENFQPHLKKLSPVFENRSSDSAIVVNVARFHDARIKGHFESAIQFHFKLMALTAKNEALTQFLDSLGYRYDKESGMLGNVCPFGIPKERLAENWASILAAYKSLPKPHPHGLDIYFFQLADAASATIEPEVSSNRLQLTSLEKMIIECLNKAVDSEDASVIEKARTSFLEHSFQQEDTDVHRALYFLVDGMLETKGETGNKNNGLLQLLRIHAEFGRRTSAISAAGLYQVSQLLRKNGSLNDAKKVAQELKSRYPSSIFAKQLKINTTE